MSIKEKKEWLVCKLPPNHPGGQRKVAGIMFGISPQAVLITKEEKEIIEKDGYLIIVTQGEQYEEAMRNIKKKIKAMKAQEKNLPIEDIKDEDITIEDMEEAEVKKEIEPKLIKSMTKKELVAKLVERGLKADEDFSSESKKEDLIKLLETLS